MRRLRPAAAVLAASLLLAGADPSRAARGAPGEVREPLLAGRFYPADPDMLRRAVASFLADAVPPKAGRPAAIVAPHAGYVFSGQIAADAWAQARENEVDVVVILGTNHTTPPFGGAAIHPGAGFRTPLGAAETDGKTAKALAAAGSGFLLEAGPHEKEHSVEVQLPFAQVLFPRARIVPAVVGTDEPAACDRLGRALAKALARRKALVVASTDLSHYPPAAEAAAVDRKVLSAAARLDPVAVRAAIAGEASRGVPGLATCACGEGPLLVAIAYARAAGATRGIVASYAHSGDVPVGDPGRVVGYGALAFTSSPGAPDLSALDPPPAAAAGPLDGAARKALLALARETIRRYLDTGTVPLPRNLPAGAQAARGAFVTLRHGNDLRGCIGHLLPDRPLGQVVGAMALQAALHDRRFPPVAAWEIPALAIEISALTPLSPVPGADAIVVGRDGVLLEKDGRSAVFLPQVPVEQGWSREETLDQLCRKAGLSPGSWRDGARLSVFRAEVFSEGKGR